MHSAKEPRWMCKVMMEDIQSGESQELTCSTKGIIKQDFTLLDQRLCACCSAMIIYGSIHTYLAVYRGKRNFLCKKAFQDQLPNINKQKLIDSKLQFPPTRKPGVKFPRLPTNCNFQFSNYVENCETSKHFLTKTVERATGSCTCSSTSVGSFLLASGIVL